MNLTINHDSGELSLTLTREEVESLFKNYYNAATSSTTAPKLAERPKPSPFYKGMKKRIKAFLEDLYKEFGNLPFSPKDERFKQIRYEHRITAIGGIFSRLEETGHVILETTGDEDYHSKRYKSIQLWW
jgi:endonuclease III-like uncharacterized protein